MRVIRTELFLPADTLLRGEGRSRLKSTNISIAWINEPDQRIPSATARPISKDETPFVIDFILRQEPPDWRFSDTIENRKVLNNWLVERVLATEVVIEQSPPEWETLSNILKSGIKGSGTVALSVYVALSGDVMLFVTLPAALLIVGAAKGTSKWLEQTIPKMLNKSTRRYWR
jgi:hypothetical protein